MNLIRDIRLYASEVPNVDGNRLPHRLRPLYAYDDMDVLDVIQRLVFALRWRGFCFADFDHLYLNLTPCLPHGEVRTVNRSRCREENRIRYVDVGCCVAMFNNWPLEEQNRFVTGAIAQAARLMAPVGQKKLLEECLDLVLTRGAQLLIPYRERSNDALKLEILTRITDDLDFLPLLRVTDMEGKLLCEHSLRAYGRDEFICQFSTVTFGKRSVRIQPRKNWDTDYYGLKPIKLRW